MLASSSDHNPPQIHLKVIIDLRNSTGLESVTSELKKRLANIDAHCVDTLLMGNCQLENLLPQSNFKEVADHLRFIDLSWNNLRSLEKLTCLTKLEKLVAFSNKLAHLPDTLFERLYHLTYLDLSRNELETIPATLFTFCPKLARLDLSHNKLNAIPSSIGSSPNISYLNVSYNNLKSIPREFQQVTALETLDLSYNRIQDIPNDAFLNCYQMTRLFLQKNSLAILPDLSDLISLHILDIRFSRIHQLPTSLVKLAHLSYLYIADEIEWKRYDLVKSFLQNPSFPIPLTGSEDDEGIGNLATLSFPPLEICRQGLPTIVKFLRKHLWNTIQT